MKRRIIEPAPGMDAAVPGASLNEILSWAQDPELRSAVHRANSEYLYWDKFKHLPLPDGLDPKLAWTLVKVTRTLDRHPTPVAEVTGGMFSYTRTAEVLRCIHEIDKRAAGSFAVEADGIPGDNRKRFLVNSLMEEAIASSQIEGASTTTKVAKDMLRTGREPTDRAERMILNNYRTIQNIRECVAQPLTPQLLCALQQSMTEGTLENAGDSGRFRTNGDEIVIIDGAKDEVLHVPPRAEVLADQIQMLCDYANNEDGEFEHPVLKAIVLHFWLAYLHPFVDGNGRTARALLYLHMLKRGYWMFEYLSISRVILNRRGQYDKAYLYSEQDECDMTYFVTFNLHAIIQSLDELQVYLERKASEDAALWWAVKADSGLNHRQRALLTRARKDPYVQITIESHANSHEVAYATSRADLLALVAQGYLVQQRKGRKFIFTPAPGLRASFESNGTSVP